MSKSNILPRGYISLFYSAAPQCANTKCHEDPLTHAGHTWYAQQSYFSFPRPWLRTLRVQLPTWPEVARQT
jgi:hypothetical protein